MQRTSLGIGMQIIQQNNIFSTPWRRVYRIIQTIPTLYHPWHSPPVKFNPARFFRPDSRYFCAAMRTFSFARQTVFRDYVSRSSHDNSVTVWAKGAFVFAYPPGDVASVDITEAG